MRPSTPSPRLLPPSPSSSSRADDLINTRSFAWFSLANWYIIMEILTTSLADDSFGLTGIKYFNTVVKYYYIALLRAFSVSLFPLFSLLFRRTKADRDPRPYHTVCCFILALGNRPAGSARFYLVIMVSFGLITTYMLVRPSPPPLLYSTNLIVRTGRGGSNHLLRRQERDRLGQGGRGNGHRERYLCEPHVRDDRRVVAVDLWAVYGVESDLLGRAYHSSLSSFSESSDIRGRG